MSPELTQTALLATRQNKNKIDRTDVARAYDRVLLGPKREDILTEDDKRRTAYHEAGHTIVGWNLPAGDPPQKVTIVPTMGARTRAQLAEALAGLDVALSADEVATLEAAVPADQVAGLRYAAPMMAALDSER